MQNFNLSQSNEKNVTNANEKGLQLFNFNNSPVRTLTNEKGDIFFVASDVCKILDLSNVGQALSRLDDDEKSYIILNDVTNGTPKLTIINESGLYSLVLSSRKPEAKAFKKWVTNEVLPQIRKTGNYIAQNKTQAELLLDNVQMLVNLEREQKAQAERMTMIEAKQSTINQDYFTVSGFYRIKNKKWNLSNEEAQQIGKKLSALSIVRDTEVIKVSDAKYGKINSYHIDILNEYFSKK